MNRIGLVFATAGFLAIVGCGGTPVHLTDTFYDLEAPTEARRGETVVVRLETSGPDGCYRGGYAVAQAFLDPITLTVSFQARAEPRRAPHLPWYDITCSLMPVDVDVQAAFVPPKAGRYTLEARIVPLPDRTSTQVLERIGIEHVAHKPMPRGPFTLRWNLDVKD